jgi:hypothetical protein
MPWQNAPVSGLQRIAVILVAVIAILGLAVVALALVDGAPTAGPGSSATALPSGQTSPSAEPAPRETDIPDDEEILAVLREIEEQVIAIRGLPAADIGDPDLLGREEARVELRRLFDENYSAEDRERDNIALRALGLIEPDQDVAELQLELIGDSVLGFYDDDAKRMVVVSDAGLDAQAKMTYAHEYAHALQDAAYGLDSLETDAEGQDDRALARTAFIEGDASLVMLSWAFAHLTPEELSEIATAPLPDTSGIPSWMVEQLVVFPYNEGLVWASAVAGGNPIAPDFTDIDAAFEAPPDSSEQIVHVEKWEAREAPIVVEVPDLAGALGDGWTEIDETPIGEASLRMMLEYHGVPRDEALAATEGWGGDRAVIVSGADEGFAVAWRLAWDTPADAQEFLSAYRSIVNGFGFPASVIEVSGGEILVAHASTADLLRLTVDAAND